MHQIKTRQRFLKYNLAICGIIIIFLFFIPKEQSSGESIKIRVLFIGNSLTSVNDLPRSIAELAKSRNCYMEYDVYAPGGYRLSQHAADPLVLKKINQRAWDFVVLQEQSQLPAFSQEQVQREIYPYAKKLSQLIRNANPKARIVFYMTMANKNGNPQNFHIFPELGTYEGMQRRINASYISMAQQNQGLVVPVGLVWENVRLKRPSLDLYTDDTHPNPVGTYLTACVFYEILFKDSPVGLPHSKQIDDNTANFLQRITDNTVTSESWDWDKGSSN